MSRSSDLVARLGWEAFIIILPSTGREGALNLAERAGAYIEKMDVERRKVAEKLGIKTSD